MLLSVCSVEPKRDTNPPEAGNIFNSTSRRNSFVPVACHFLYLKRPGEKGGGEEGRERINEPGRKKLEKHNSDLCCCVPRLRSPATSLYLLIRKAYFPAAG